MAKLSPSLSKFAPHSTSHSPKNAFLVNGSTMGLFEKIANYLSSSGTGDKNAYWIYVRCDLCGEDLRSRINLFNDLSVEYRENNDQTYICRKTLVGRTGCFQRIEVVLKFDKDRKMIQRQISGGDFIEEVEFTPEDKTA